MNKITDHKNDQIEGVYCTKFLDILLNSNCNQSKRIPNIFSKNIEIHCYLLLSSQITEWTPTNYLFSIT